MEAFCTSTVTQTGLWSARHRGTIINFATIHKSCGKNIVRSLQSEQGQYCLLPTRNKHGIKESCLCSLPALRSMSYFLPMVYRSGSQPFLVTTPNTWTVVSDAHNRYFWFKLCQRCAFQMIKWPPEMILRKAWLRDTALVLISPSLTRCTALLHLMPFRIGSLDPKMLHNFGNHQDKSSLVVGHRLYSETNK